MSLDRVENELRSALRRQAALVDRWIDGRSVHRGGPHMSHEGVGRPRPLVSGAVALGLFILVSAAAIWVRSGTPANPDRAAAGPKSSASSTSPAITCPTPPFRPTRLPWLPASSPLPAPEEVTYQDGASSLVWFEDPEAKWQGPYVALTTYPAA